MISKCEAAASVNSRERVSRRSELVLSLFPGIDLLGRAFESVGYCVVRGPDLIIGGDIRDFVGVPGRFDGIIGGPPCQGFSAANRYRTDPNHHSVKNSIEMLRQFLRVVDECQPTWWALENVPSVPDCRIDGYAVQRVPISDQQCGGVQIRTRHIQFGHKDGWIIRPDRIGETVNQKGTVICRRRTGPVVEAVTTKPNSKWSSFSDQCRKQGLDPSEVKLPGMSREAKFRAVGNGVPLTIGKAIAEAIKRAGPVSKIDCPCGCGRTLKGKQKSATVSCRKRLQLRREGNGEKTISI